MNPRRSPGRVTKHYNRTAAFAKVTMCPPEKLDVHRIASIAHSHGLSVEEVEQMVAERREACRG